MPAIRPARRGDRKILPMPEATCTIPVGLEIFGGGREHASSTRESGAVITEAKANRDAKEYNGRDDDDALLIRFLIEAIQLGRNVPLPVRRAP
jgi:hypothetical protein